MLTKVDETDMNGTIDLEDDNILDQLGIDMYEDSPSQFMPRNSLDTSELQEAESTVMFVFASLKISLGMRHNQVGGLLANQHKFLIHMCIKGMKGRDYSKIIAWYKLIYNHIGQLIFLL